MTSIVRPSAEAAGGHEHYRLRIEGFGVGTWDLDLRTRELEWSDAARSLFGVAQGRSITLDAFLALLEPKDRERTEQAMERVIGSGGGFDVSFKVNRSKGRGQWIRARAGLIKDESGSPRHVSGIFLDIGEEKQLEEALSARESHLRSILDTVPDAMIVIERLRQYSALQHRRRTVVRLLRTGGRRLECQRVDARA